MAANLDGQLVVAISSRALFDFEEENRVFETGHAQEPAAGAKKDAAYMKLQLDRLDVPAKPGVAFSLSRSCWLSTMCPKYRTNRAAPRPRSRRPDSASKS